MHENFAERQVSDDVFLRPLKIFISMLGENLSNRHTHVPTSVTRVHFGSYRSVPDWGGQRGMGASACFDYGRVGVLAKVHTGSLSPLRVHALRKLPRERMLLFLILSIAL